MYLLARHVHLCRTTNHCVLLDLRADRYLCVDRPSFDALTPWLQGWPDVGGAISGDIECTDASTVALAGELLTRGILTTHAAEGKAALPAEGTTAKRELPLKQARISGLRGVAFILPFFIACHMAEARLRKSLETTIEHVARRKRHHAYASRTTSLAAIEDLALVFAALRLFYPREYLCLFDSLALIEFMNFFKIFPEWIFGVTADPFNAHCWVQADGVLLNDTKSRLAEYNIIMRV